MLVKQFLPTYLHILFPVSSTIICFYPCLSVCIRGSNAFLRVSVSR
jgi:hypothetical protein